MCYSPINHYLWIASISCAQAIKICNSSDTSFRRFAIKINFLPAVHAQQHIDITIGEFIALLEALTRIPRELWKSLAD